ncbi:hypothetical protein C8039_01740 [Halogeometricum sp. wsp3]|nr:hypothetical protein C8039_01740 [Halogeometricum sp. wsp3]
MFAFNARTSPSRLPGRRRR